MKTTKKAILSGFKGAVKSSKLIASSTAEIIQPDDLKIIRLHQTNIIVYLGNGNFILDSGGWRTPTTKDRISQFSPAGIAQQSREWYVAPGNAWPPREKKALAQWLEDPIRNLFYDGIELTAHCKLVGIPATAEDVATREDKRKLIRKYVNLLDHYDKLPEPDSGDCWGCAMKDVKTGKTVMGESHLDTHITEESFNGSLIVNALMYVGHHKEGLSIVWHMSNRKPLKKALYKYLTDKLVYRVQNTVGKSDGFCKARSN